jgi:predicted SnoaL-like aldol condensation-catalyzing enzyme
MSKKLENAMNLYIEGIKDGKPRDAVTKYTGNKYTQNSNGVKDGKEDFIEFFKSFIKRNPIRDIKIVRSIVDDQYVFLHVYQSLKNGKAKWVTTNFFDTDENDKIIEHWDVISPYSDSTPSGHTSIDGPTENKDLDKTEINKQLFRNLIKDALMPGGDPTKLEDYISSDQYIQHNKDVYDGLESFKKLANTPDRPLNYTEIVILVGQVNFVATLYKANWKDKKINQDYAQVDLFRIENGEVVEHWDDVEPVPPKEELVNSGKL